MPNFIVNKNAQATGEHEVHNLDNNCKYLPDENNQIELGNHLTCQSAVYSARAYFIHVDGCFYCASDCHTK